MSGISSLASWPLFQEYLRYNNFSDSQIEDLTFNNVIKRYGIDIKKSNRKIKDRRKDYPINFYEVIEKKINYKD